APRPRALPVRPRPARHRRGLAARQRRRLVAPRSHGGLARRRPGPPGLRGPRLRLGRGPLDPQGRHRRGGPGAGPLRLRLRALQLARRGRVPGQAPLGDALPVRRSPREEGRQVTMAETRADALVFFGATGDLAYKKIFPSLQAMIRRGHLDVPVIGVAKSGWNLEQFRARVRDSLEKHGRHDAAAAAQRRKLTRYVDGDYGDAATFKT